MFARVSCDRSATHAFRIEDKNAMVGVADFSTSLIHRGKTMQNTMNVEENCKTHGNARNKQKKT